MRQKNIPCYMHPTEVILIDDNIQFLKNLEIALGREFKCRSFSDPKKALEHISQNVQSGTSISKYITEEDLKVPLPDIHKEIYNKNRFKEISAVVVDYGMPSMNGLELCKKIRACTQNPIQLIMLTGEADLPTAVQAFNESLIDKFILKSGGDYTREVAEAIHASQEKYFFFLSEPLRRSLQADAQKLLEEDEFFKLLNQIIEKNHSKEFYLLEDSLSLLFLDDKAEKPVWLIMKTEDDMGTQYELAKSDHASPAIVEALKKKKKVAYFPNQKTLSESAERWVLHDAKVLKGKKSYYYAIVSDSKQYPLDKNKIASYYAYINRG